MSRRDKKRGGSDSSMKWMEADDDPTGDAVSAEQHRLLREALEHLRVPDRDILRLRFVRRLSSTAIATQLGISQAAVDMRLTRAKRRVEDILQDQGLGAAQML